MNQAITIHKYVPCSIIIFCLSCNGYFPYYNTFAHVSHSIFNYSQFNMNVFSIMSFCNYEKKYFIWNCNNIITPFWNNYEKLLNYLILASCHLVNSFPCKAYGGKYNYSICPLMYTVIKRSGICKHILDQRPRSTYN